MSRPLNIRLNWLESQLYKLLLKDERREVEKVWKIGNGRILRGTKKVVNPLTGRSVITLSQEKE